jgi:hypothetical protein
MTQRSPIEDQKAIHREGRKLINETRTKLDEFNATDPRPGTERYHLLALDLEVAIDQGRISLLDNKRAMGIIRLIDLYIKNATPLPSFNDEEWEDPASDATTDGEACQTPPADPSDSQKTVEIAGPKTDPSDSQNKTKMTVPPEDEPKAKPASGLRLGEDRPPSRKPKLAKRASDEPKPSAPTGAGGAGRPTVVLPPAQRERAASEAPTQIFDRGEVSGETKGAESEPKAATPETTTPPEASDKERKETVTWKTAANLLTEALAIAEPAKDPSTRPEPSAQADASSTPDQTPQPPPQEPKVSPPEVQPPPPAPADAERAAVAPPPEAPVENPAPAATEPKTPSTPPVEIKRSEPTFEDLKSDRFTILTARSKYPDGKWMYPTDLLRSFYEMCRNAGNAADALRGPRSVAFYELAARALIFNSPFNSDMGKMDPDDLRRFVSNVDFGRSLETDELRSAILEGSRMSADRYLRQLDERNKEAREQSIKSRLSNAPPANGSTPPPGSIPPVSHFPLPPRTGIPVPRGKGRITSGAVTAHGIGAPGTQHEAGQGLKTVLFLLATLISGAAAYLLWFAGP